MGVPPTSGGRIRGDRHDHRTPHLRAGPLRSYLGRVAGILGAVFGLLVVVLALQGRHVQRTMVRLPEALEPDGVFGVGDPWDLVVVGDSVAAGVGVEHHDISLVGRLAEQLAVGRSVRRTVIARSGLDAGEVRDLVAGREEIARADAIVVSVGVNDIKHLHTTRRWRRNLVGLLDELSGAAPDAVIVLIGIAPMEQLVVLPRFLRAPLGHRSRRLDRIGRIVASHYPQVRRLEIDPDAFSAFPAPFASDGLHPSEETYATFAVEIARIIDPAVD